MEHNGTEVRRARYHVRASELASKFDPDLEPEFAERACNVARMVVSGESDRTIDNALLGLWGEAEKAIRIYMTEDGIVHWAGRPKQVVIDAPQCLTVVNGKLKEYIEVNLYGLLEEGKGKEDQ